MRASDLVVGYPTVTMQTPAIEAAWILAGRDLPGLVVVDGSGPLASAIKAARHRLQLLSHSFIAGR